MTAPTLVTTVAGTTSNSYATVAEADAYLADRGATAWHDLAAETKVRKLIAAAKLLDRYPFDGYRYDVSTSRVGGYPGQARSFPRSIDLDSDGDPFVPDEVKEAQSEVAFALATSRDSGLPSAPSLKSFSVGSLSASFDSGDASGSQIDRIIRSVLGHRILSSVEME